MAKKIFTTIQYVIDSIFNHNKDTTAHEDVRTAIADGDGALSNEITVLSGKSLIFRGTVIDFDQTNTMGLYTVTPDAIGGRPQFDYGKLEVTVVADYVYHEATDIVSGKTYKRKKLEDTWSEWKQLATVDSSLQVFKGQNGPIKSFSETGIYMGTFTDLPPMLPTSHQDGQGVIEVRNYMGDTENGWREITFQSAHDMSTEYKISMASNMWSDWKQIATTDKIDILWDGNMATGTTTLSKPAVGYNSILINYGSTTWSAYTLDRTPYNVIDGIYSIAVPDGKVVFKLTGTTMEITASPVPIRRIVGILRGDKQ